MIPEEPSDNCWKNRFLSGCLSFGKCQDQEDKVSSFERKQGDTNEPLISKKKRKCHKGRTDTEVTFSKKLANVFPKTTEEAVAYSLYNRYDKRWLEVRSRCKLYLVFWILLLLVLLIFVLIVRDISIDNEVLSGTESITTKRILFQSEVSFLISNDNYLSVEMASDPTYNLTAYFLCAKSSSPVCGSESDYSQGGFVIKRNISGNFDSLLHGRSSAWYTINIEVEVDSAGSVYDNNTVHFVYDSYLKTCDKMKMYYIRYDGSIDVSNLMNPRYHVPIMVEVNKTC